MHGLLGALLLSFGLGSAAPPQLPPAAPVAASPLAASVVHARPDLPRPYFGARYYRSNVGRFTTVDPVVPQKAAILDPQRWNRYAYGRNNPFRYVDPDGRDIAIPASVNRSDRGFLVNALTAVDRRPGGREFLNALIASKNTVNFTVGNVNTPENVAAVRGGKSAPLTFGTTTFRDPSTGDVTVTIDRAALGEFASRANLDSNGVVTTAHEILHAREAVSGDAATWSTGDDPTTSAPHGRAEQFGQAVRREKPDVSAQDARRSVNEALDRKPQQQ